MLEKIFQLDRSHGSVTQYVAAKWNAVKKFNEYRNTQQNHFDLKCMMIVDDILEIQT